MNTSTMDDDQRASLENLIQKISNDENILNPVVNYSTNSPKTGYMGTIVKIQIIGDNKELRLVAKCASSDESFRENISVRDLFLQEIKFYEELVPLFTTLQERFAAKNPFTSTAKYYRCSDVPKCEFIILEDVSYAGYKLKDSLSTMNVEHIEFVLNEYAKYHAISFAYKSHDYKGYLKVIKNVDNIMRKFWVEDDIDIFAKSLNNLKELLNPNDDFYDGFAKICSDVKKYYGNSLLTEEHVVLIHGDSWCNNMMFKYEDDSNQPTSMKFLDFQLMGSCSVAMDVSYFIMANSSPDLIKNTDQFLKLYYDNLARYLRELNVNPDVVFPYSSFMDQWRKHSLYGLVLSITSLKFAMTESEERPDLTKDFANALNFVGKHDDAYKIRTEAIIRYYHEAGII